MVVPRVPGTWRCVRPPRTLLRRGWLSCVGAKAMLCGVALATVVLSIVHVGLAQSTATGWVDRVVVRFWAPELGGVDAPSYIFERELAFEARLVALADRQFVPTEQEPFTQAHVREALERHVAEAILESLRVTPTPTASDISERVRAAEASLSSELGGATVLGQVAHVEGLEQREVYRFLQRRARASLYIDRMVAPMLSPSEAELQALHASGRTPFSRQSYAVAATALRRWYIARNLRHAVQTYYNGARARIKLTVVGANQSGLPLSAN